MSDPELGLFQDALGGCRGYLEFGMGGSSLRAVRAGIADIVLVDSDPAWVQAVRAHPEIAAAIAAGRVSALHGDIGPVRDWGNPEGRGAIERWPHYLATGWAAWAARNTLPDLVFVDGRFRVACCLSVVAATAGRAAPRVLLHDFNDERPHYRDVLDFFEIATLVDSLCLLRLRADAEPAAALAGLLGRQFDYG